MAEYTIFDILKFILGSKAWGNKTKEFIIEPQDDFFCFIPPSLMQPSMNVNIYWNWSICYWAKRLIYRIMPNFQGLLVLLTECTEGRLLFLRSFHQHIIMYVTDCQLWFQVNFDLTHGRLILNLLCFLALIHE